MMPCRTPRLAALLPPEIFPLPRFSLSICDLARAGRATLSGTVELIEMHLGATSTTSITAANHSLRTLLPRRSAPGLSPRRAWRLEGRDHRLRAPSMRERRMWTTHLSAPTTLASDRDPWITLSEDALIRDEGTVEVAEAQHQRVAELDSVVVTGAAGFIGSHLAQTLLREGVRVMGLDSRGSHGQRAAENLAACFRHKTFGFIRADIRQADLRQVLNGCDAVFHLAALAGVRSSWGGRFEDYLTVNVSGTHRLLEACEQVGIPRLVLASSSSVYGGQDGQPSAEDGATAPLSPYGVTKLAAERLAIAYALRPSASTSVVALRYFSVYGPRQRPDMWIGRVLQAALDGQRVTVFGDGDQRRDFTYVDDVVAATIAAANTPAVAEVVNVGTGVTTSLADVLRIAERISGRSVSVEHLPAAEGDAGTTWADAGKAHRLLNGRPATNLEDGMTAQWSWLSTRSRAATTRAEYVSSMGAGVTA